MNFIIRKTHKYLSFAISLQLLLWTISGIYFAFNKIELVRGEQYLTQKQHSIDLGEIDFKFSSIKTLDIKKRLNEDIVIIKTANKIRFTPTPKPINETSLPQVAQPDNPLNPYHPPPTLNSTHTHCSNAKPTSHSTDRCSMKSFLQPQEILLAAARNLSCDK